MIEEAMAVVVKQGEGRKEVEEGRGGWGRVGIFFIFKCGTHIFRNYIY